MSGHVPPPPPPPGQPRQPGKARVGSTEFTWPVPEKRLAVGGRQLSLETVAAAALHALAALWLLVDSRGIFGELGRVVTGPFSGEAFDFVIGFTFTYLLGLLLLVIAAATLTAVLLINASPQAQPAAIVSASLLLAGVLGGGASGLTVLLALLATVGTVAVVLSPWTAPAPIPPTTGRPAPVAISLMLGLAVFAIHAYVGLYGVPGLRFLGDDFVSLGASFVLTVLLFLAGGVVGLVGVVLAGRRNRQGRVLVSAGAGAAFLGLLIGDFGSDLLLPLVALVAVVAPLWLAPSARAWFGDSRTDLLS